MPIKKSESEEHYQLKSFLNVIADSGVVETYLLTKTDMQYLPDSDLRLIYDEIVQIKEVDRPSTKESVAEKFSQLCDWENFKWKQVESVVGRQKMEKAYKSQN